MTGEWLVLSSDCRRGISIFGPRSGLSLRASVFLTLLVIASR
jgi:hypothetical protein